MLPVKLLILLLFVTVSYTNPIPTIPTIPTVSPDTANAYLRSFLPWWPNNTDFTLTTTVTPLEANNYTEGSGSLLELSDDNENKTISDDGELDPATLRVQDIPSSPLDELRPDSAPKSLISDHIDHNDGNFIINFDEMGDCPRDCSNDLREAMNIVLQDMSHVERYHRICEKYLNASTCVNEDARCDKDDRGMFEMMTSGLHYMCVEQELAFNATIKCIDDEAGLVQSECDAQCQTKNLFMNWMMRTAFQDSIQQGVNGIVGAATGTNANPLAFLQGVEGAAGGTPTGWADMLATAGQRPPSPQDAQQGFENFRQFTNDLCRIGDCMLDCIRSKFNTRCEGSAGTLLSEVFVRPIAASQNKLSILRPVLGSFMPEQCNYLHNNADLKKHRIDSTMDEELKRMYAEKVAKEVRERTQQDELLSNLVPLDENGVPLPRALPDLKQVDSPLDVSVKTLDQLILDMYSKNETKSLKVSKNNNVTTSISEPEEMESLMNSTSASTDKSNTTIVEVTTVKYDISEKKGSDVSVEKSVDESQDESSTEMFSGENEYSGSEDETENESSGSTRESSGDDVLSDSNTDASGSIISEEDENSGSAAEITEENDSSGLIEEQDNVESSGTASSSSTGILHQYTDNSTETFEEVESSGSGEASGEYEASGQDILPLKSTSDDTYTM